MMTDGRLAAVVSGAAAVTAGTVVAALVAWGDGPPGRIAAVLFLVCLVSVLALFASVIVSADRYVRTLPPPPGRKHGVVRGWCTRQLGRAAHVVRAGALVVWRTGARGARAARVGLRAENRHAAREAFTRFGSAAMVVAFGGPPDDVECAERPARTQGGGRHPRRGARGEVRLRPRRFRSRSIAPHDAFALVMRTPPRDQSHWVTSPAERRDK